MAANLRIELYELSRNLYKDYLTAIQIIFIVNKKY